MLKEKMVFLQIRSQYLIALFLVLLLQACAGTDMAKKLSQSFDVENTEINEDDEINKNMLGNESVKPRDIDTGKKNSTIDNSVSYKELERMENKSFNKRNDICKVSESFEVMPFTPQPYRIIIKLSEANPSAPAEVLTRTLRKAGVVFEVEKIERYFDGTSQSLPSKKR